MTSHRMENVRVLQCSASGLRLLTQNIKVSAPEKGKFCFVKHVSGVCLAGRVGVEQAFAGQGQRLGAQTEKGE